MPSFLFFFLYIIISINQFPLIKSNLKLHFSLLLVTENIFIEFLVLFDLNCFIELLLKYEPNRINNRLAGYCLIKKCLGTVQLLMVSLTHLLFGL
jgi:hypothetical protein